MWVQPLSENYWIHNKEAWAMPWVYQHIYGFVEQKKPGINKWRFFSSKLPIHNIKSLWFYLGNNFCSCTGLHILSSENCYKNCGSEMNSIKSETSDGAIWKLWWKISFCLWDYIFRKRTFTFLNLSHVQRIKKNKQLSMLYRSCE